MMMVKVDVRAEHGNGYDQVKCLHYSGGSEAAFGVHMLVLAYHVLCNIKPVGCTRKRASEGEV